MQKTRTFWCVLSLTALAGLFSTGASAAPVSPPPPPCTLDSFTITKIEKSPLDGNNVIYSGSQNATKCVGLLSGNDSGNPFNTNNPNIGHLNDGLLNGQEGLLSPTWFNNPATPSPMLDLDNNGTYTDPGWIFLGKAEQQGTSFGMDPYDKPLDLGDILNVQFKCTGSGDSACTKGTWSLETSLDIIEQVQAVLGRNSFDHLAFVIKASTEFAVYDFDFNELSAGLPGFGYSTPYSFTGTWNTDDFVNKKGKAQNVSHFSVWARDPVPAATNEVPEPGVVFLVALGLLGVAAAQRRRAA